MKNVMRPRQAALAFWALIGLVVLAIGPFVLMIVAGLASGLAAIVAWAVFVMRALRRQRSEAAPDLG